MERKDIDKASTWDVQSIYASYEAFQEDVKIAESLMQQLADYKGKLTTSLDNLEDFLTKNDDAGRYIDKLYCYAHLQCDVEPENQTYQTMLATVMNLINTASVSLSFIDTEICAHEEAVLQYIEHPNMKKYRYKLGNILAYKPHMLPPEQEELLAKVSTISNTGSQVFDSLRLEYEDVMIDNKAHTLNGATLTKFLKNENEAVRKQAYHKFYQEYQKLENTYATTLSGVMKRDSFYANVRKFDSSLEASVFDDEVPSALFFKILSMANTTYRPLFHKYNALKKQILQKETLYNYDLTVPLVKNVTKNFSLEECFSIIHECIQPFGNEYASIIEKAKQERWIDFYPTKGKRTGAYSSGSYDTKPFILMNFIGDYNSLTTMIHELGHSVHSYFSNHHQPYCNANYRIIVAEVASTVNETLLINHMIKHASTPEEKAYYIYEQLENCVGLLFRQPMFADFEYKLHTMAEKNEPLASKNITDLYTKLSEEYFGKDVTLDPLTGWSCYYVPHFYYNYYVYKYTLGITVALAIVKRILSGDQEQVDRYLQFLRSGSSKAPMDLLQEAGVNPLDDHIYEDAFQYFAELLEQFENIMIQQ